MWEKSSELDSNRGAKCFGCLVSTEAHWDDGCQVILRQTLCGCGSRARATAWQNQRGSEICNQSQRRGTWALSQANYWQNIFFFQSTFPRSAHLSLPYGSWSNSWQRQFQYCRCSTLLFCRPPAGIPSRITGTQWNHRGPELWREEKHALWNFCFTVFNKRCLRKLKNYFHNNSKTRKAKEL